MQLSPGVPTIRYTAATHSERDIACQLRKLRPPPPRRSWRGWHCPIMEPADKLRTRKRIASQSDRRLFSSRMAASTEFADTVLLRVPSPLFALDATCQPPVRRPHRVRHQILRSWPATCCLHHWSHWSAVKRRTLRPSVARRRRSPRGFSFPQFQISETGSSCENITPPPKKPPRETPD